MNKKNWKPDINFGMKHLFITTFMALASTTTFAQGLSCTDAYSGCIRQCKTDAPKLRAEYTPCGKSCAETKKECKKADAERIAAENEARAQDSKQWLSEQDVVLGYDFEQIRNYCSYVKLVSAQFKPEYKERFIDEVIGHYGMIFNSAGEFERRRGKEKFKSWLNGCVSKAKMPGNTFLASGTVAYSGYDFKYKSMSLGMNLSDRQNIPEDIVDSWKQQYVDAGFEARPRHSFSVVFGKGFGATENLFVGQYRSQSTDINIKLDEESAERFMKGTGNQNVPVIAKLRLAGFQNENMFVFGTDLVSIKTKAVGNSPALNYTYPK